MSLCVLDLNDAGLTIADGATLLSESPAYATLEPGGIVLGEAARARARVDPRQTHTRFWQRLGTEALHNATAHARHNADLAFRHLQHLHAQASACTELILAVPGTLGREQLALLLGIAERCEFRAVGLVDAALAAAAQADASSAPLLHVEQQLHQCVLTRIDREGGQLVRREARALPGTGVLDMLERWARRAAAAFIQQTRFDPLHEAASEQLLYDALPGWLARLAREDDTEAQLAGGTARHLARLRAQDMLDAVNGPYTELLEAIRRDGSGRRVLLGPRAAQLPRFVERIPNASSVDALAVSRGALACADHIRGEERALRFVIRLPAPPNTEGPGEQPGPKAAPPVVPLATHLLDGDRALRLVRERQYLCRDSDGRWMFASTPAPGTACCLRRSAGGWLAEPHGAGRLRIDGHEIAGAVALLTGNKICIDGAPELRLIAESVAHDDGA